MEDNKDMVLNNVIIEQWTEKYPPAGDDDMYFLQLSSYEIAEILNDFCNVEAGEITSVLLRKGYKLTRTGEGEIKWMIKK